MIQPHNGYHKQKWQLCKQAASVHKVIEILLFSTPSTHGLSRNQSVANTSEATKTIKNLYNQYHCSILQ